MPNTELTDELILEEVRSELGASAVQVELEDDDIRKAYAKALRVYNRYLPMSGRQRLVVASSTKKYRIDNVVPRLIGVVDVNFITRRVNPGGVDVFDPYVTSLTGPNYGDETFGDVMMRRMYAEDAQRIIGAEPEWLGQWETVGAERQYFLYVDVYRNTIECAYTYSQLYANTDAPGDGRLAIPDGDVDWFHRYTIAVCSKKLGHIRGKFGGIGNPEGSQDPVESDRLLDEGKEELEALETEIRARRRAFLPVIE